jgi:hypothetical protein
MKIPKKYPKKRKVPPNVLQRHPEKKNDYEKYKITQKSGQKSDSRKITTDQTKRKFQMMKTVKYDGKLFRQC